jgi:phenylpropionate dioxygenase-like ring-hydroxylating dioxygenase large terminal subunit
MTETFANPRRFVQSWYVAALSSELRAGTAFSKPLLGRRITLFRGHDGRVRALNARCAHLGADLGAGDVVGDQLRCAFHHWTYDGSGRCVHVPSLSQPPESACTFAYPVEERWGAIWIFNGRHPAYALPEFEHRRAEELLVTRLRPRVLGCHPHLAVANGLDIEHYKTVHGFDFVREPLVEALDPFRVRATLEVRLRADSLPARGLRALTGGLFHALFTTWGGNMATIEGRAGAVPVLVLFTHRPLDDGRSASQTFLFHPRGRGRVAGFAGFQLAVARLVMAYILARDREVLDTVSFRPNLVAADAPLAAFMRQVNALPTLDA